MFRAPHRVFLVVASLLGVAGCGSSMARSGGTAATTASPAGALNVSGVMQWNAVLVAQSGSNLSGSAMVTSDGPNNRTVAGIRLSGGAAGDVYPWHVHTGHCGDAGAPIVGSPQAYPPLTVASDGTTRGQAELPITVPNGNYHVMVHRSASDMGTVVACGNLQ